MKISKVLPVTVVGRHPVTQIAEVAVVPVVPVVVHTVRYKLGIPHSRSTGLAVEGGKNTIGLLG
jgi:hypothetical protein